MIHDEQCDLEDDNVGNVDVDVDVDVVDDDIESALSYSLLSMASSTSALYSNVLGTTSEYVES